MNLTTLAHRHCAAHKPQLNLKGFIVDQYGINYAAFARIANGERPASTRLLQRVNNAHVRLFPSEPVTLELSGLSINLGHSL